MIDRINNLLTEYLNGIIGMHFYLDVLITDFISYYFIECHSDKRKEFIQLFLDHEPFKKKINILKSIISEKYPHLLEKDGAMIEKIEDLDELKNEFSHSILNIDLEFVKNFPDEILLRKFEAGEIKSIQERKDEILDECNKAFDVLEILNDEVKKMREFSNAQEALTSMTLKDLRPGPKK
jgi:hypothetical protein